MLQIAAAWLSFKLIRITGHRTAWILISAALALMAVRRAITFVRLAVDGFPDTRDPQAELVALLISGLMVGGVAMIAPDRLPARISTTLAEMT